MLSERYQSKARMRLPISD